MPDILCICTFSRSFSSSSCNLTITALIKSIFSLIGTVQAYHRVSRQCSHSFTTPYSLKAGGCSSMQYHLPVTFHTEQSFFSQHQLCYLAHNALGVRQNLGVSRCVCPVVSKQPPALPPSPLSHLIRLRSRQQIPPIPSVFLLVIVKSPTTPAPFSVSQIISVCNCVLSV